MGVLCDKEIKALIASGELKIEPFDERFLSPASYDLRVGKRVLKALKKGQGSPVSDLEKEEVLEIGTGEFVEVLTLEKLTLPANICGRMGLRSYFTRKGLMMFAGPQIDPGWRGWLIVSLFNTGPRTVVLKYKEEFCTIELSSLSQPAEKPYSGGYQDQDAFPSDNIEFIIGARGATLYEVVEKMAGMSQDIAWMKWLLLAILGALITAIVVRAVF